MANAILIICYYLLGLAQGLKYNLKFISQKVSPWNGGVTRSMIYTPYIRLVVSRSRRMEQRELGRQK